MTKTEKVEALDKLIAALFSMEEEETYHREFDSWRQRVQRQISKIFENDPLPVQHFLSIRPFRASLSSFRAYGSSEGSKKQVFEKVQQFRTFLESLKDEIPDDTLYHDQEVESKNVKKIFISHASKDDLIGKEVINLLQLIGIKHTQIFYTSAAGYGVPLGKDWVETLKSEVSSEGVVISLLSNNYFTSQICLLEMGATWVLSKLHIPILIPPLTFKDTNDLINANQGFQILDELRWSSLKQDLEKLFGLEPMDGDKWEPQRDTILDRINKLLSP
ncbi:toll/interleukin-1 receptor domain-containing protein [Algoriphagus marinus]|uniref:toll/interleukin-1 receptor domain-containing protein n=1 Tax=Algoriphagus marinus TaxID=1925762 RepID=UPI00094B905F|nr:toll/interleukin-1 receptor domain-containing protein [Algoriphagus marinus]